MSLTTTTAISSITSLVSFDLVTSVCIWGRGMAWEEGTDVYSFIDHKGKDSTFPSWVRGFIELIALYIHV